MHVPINVKSPNNISKWQIGFNSAFKGLNHEEGVAKLPRNVGKYVPVCTVSWFRRHVCSPADLLVSQVMRRDIA
jgi:hypothetical protein